MNTDQQDRQDHDEQRASVRAKDARALFDRQQRDGRIPGGQIVVQRKGEVLFEACVGIARGLRPDEGVAAQPVSPTTTFQVMSASKAVVAFAIALLEDRGLIDVNAPVARAFPEFAANGKADITVLDVLTHRSGLTLDGLVRRPESWSDWQGMVSAMAEAAPEHARGTLAYEAYAFGWILAEVVRRVTGRSLPEFLAETLPEELAGLHFRHAATEPAPAQVYWLGKPHYRLGELDLPERFEEINNTIACHRALVPGAGMIATARSLAAFYDLLLSGGVSRTGRRIVGAEVLQRYVSRQTAGRDRITGAYITLGRGFALGWRWPHVYGWWNSGRCFGHAGGFSCVAFADPVRQLSIVVLTNANRSLIDMVKRFAPLCQRLRNLGSA